MTGGVAPLDDRDVDRWTQQPRTCTGFRGLETGVEGLDPVRRAAIIRLLETSDDNLPQQTVRIDAAPGFVHDDRDHRETCPDCLANDKVMFGCETCRGAGTIRTPRSRDPYAVSTVVGVDINRHEAARERDRQIAILELQTKPPRSESDLLEEANQHGYAWESARERMYERFDYGPLNRALEQLREADDRAYRIIHAVHIYGWLTKLSAVVEAERDAALAFLSDRLPGGDVWHERAGDVDRNRQLRAPAAPPEKRVLGPMRAEAGTAAKDLRDNRMRERADTGATPAEIAVEFRVSLRTVYRVVNGEAA